MRLIVHFILWPILAAVLLKYYISSVTFNHRVSVAHVPPNPPLPVITDEHLEQFDKLGYMIIRNFTSQEWVRYLQATVDDRISHPHIWAKITGIIGGVFKYHQQNSWMTTDGMFNYFKSHGSTIQYVGSKAATYSGYEHKYSSVRLLHDSVQCHPLFKGRFFPVHDDCYPQGKCPQNLLMRLYVPLDYIPAGKSVHFLENDKGRDDPARGSDDAKWYSRFIPVSELFPGDVLIWNVTKLHSSYESERRLFTYSVQAGEAPMRFGEGNGWVGMFDPLLFERQESVFYPIIYPNVSNEVVMARETMTGYPKFNDFYKYMRQVFKPNNMGYFVARDQIASEKLSSKLVRLTFSVLDKFFLD
jgi:hypothetical protein